jgi:HSP20 family molecular chaperone IbpA
VLEFDLPGVAPDTLDIDVERNVLTIKAGSGEARTRAALDPLTFFFR